MRTSPASAIHGLTAARARAATAADIRPERGVKSSSPSPVTTRSTNAAWPVRSNVSATYESHRRLRKRRAQGARTRCHPLPRRTSGPRVDDRPASQTAQAARRPVESGPCRGPVPRHGGSSCPAARRGARRRQPRSAGRLRRHVLSRRRSRCRSSRARPGRRRARRSASRSAPSAAISPAPPSLHRCHQGRQQPSSHRRRPRRRSAARRRTCSRVRRRGTIGGCMPAACAASMYAVSPTRKTAAGTSSPQRLATVTANSSPPSEACMTSTNPGPPSDIGIDVTRRPAPVAANPRRSRRQPRRRSASRQTSRVPPRCASAIVPDRTRICRPPHGRHRVEPMPSPIEPTTQRLD